MLSTSGVNADTQLAMLKASTGDESAHTLVDVVARRSYGKLIALLAVRTADIAAAEDALAEAFVKALVDWSQHGCPTNPEAWLLTVARRKAIDLMRRQQTQATVAEKLALVTEWPDQTTDDSVIPDHRLALLFACAHPAISTDIRAPLLLQVVLGMNAAAIAAAFLLPPATMGKRLVRAKQKIKQAAIPFRIPEQEELPERLDTVLAAIYAIYAEGWSDPGGTEVARRDLAAEALFLGRLVCELLPEAPEALGLLALMLHTEARRQARRNAQGDYIPFAQQDHTLWDAALIAEAEVLLLHASTLGNIGRYQLEAALQSAHIYRHRTGQANWSAVIQLYDLLLTLSGSPVVAINRALAVAERDGAAVALQALEAITADPRVSEYQPYWAARAELLVRIGANDEAHYAYQIAIGLERDGAVRRFLQRRQATLPGKVTND